jgi:hypothetical protein
MNLQELTGIAIDTLIRLLSSTVFLLALFVGFCFFAGLPKLRKRNRKSMVVRSLSERIDGRVKYFSSDDLAGSTDQLRTPELLGQAGRQQ